MSWWIKEHIAVNEDESKQLCSIEADTQTSLPAADQTATACFIIVRGSSALVLDTGDRYIMNSVGTWIQQPSGVQLDLSGYATTQDLAAGLAGKVDTTTYSTEQAAQNAEIGAVAALGAKNFLKVTGQTQTLNGVTFTVNSDQTVSLSGTASATTTFVVSDNAATRIPNGNYVLTGCPSGGGSTTYDLRWYLYSPGKSAYDQGSGASVNKTGNTTSSNIAILIRSGVNTDGLVFRPMISPAEITDSTFVPYAPTNRELYEMILALQ
jgi:hypothetical protein